MEVVLPSSAHQDVVIMRYDWRSWRLLEECGKRVKSPKTFSSLGLAWWKWAVAIQNLDLIGRWKMTRRNLLLLLLLLPLLVQLLELLLLELHVLHLLELLVLLELLLLVDTQVLLLDMLVALLLQGKLLM